MIYANNFSNSQSLAVEHKNYKICIIRAIKPFKCEGCYLPPSNMKINIIIILLVVCLAYIYLNSSQNVNLIFCVI